MYSLVTIIGITAYAGLGKRLALQDARPSMYQCFAEFKKEVSKAHYPTQMDLRGISLGSDNDKLPIHMALYALYQPDKIQQQQDLILYMQVGECGRAKKKNYELTILIHML